VTTPGALTLCRPSERPSMIWEQGDYAEFYWSLPRARRRGDEDRLAGLFTRAAKVPKLAEALGWAEAHDVKYYIDMKMADLACYTPGTGVVGIGRRSFLIPSRAVEAISHETRHAFQDLHGLLPSAGQDFLSSWITEAAVEADAGAFGFAAGREDNRVHHPLLSAVRQEKPLWTAFTRWYASALPKDYGPAKAELYAARLGLLPRAPGSAFQTEFVQEQDIPPRSDTLLTPEARITALNRDFSGRPWFNAAAAPGFIREITDPARAARFFGRGEPSDLVRRILETENKGPRP
jgi:hypothetical protein